MMIKYKSEIDITFICDHFESCIECVIADSFGCPWFENKYEYVNDDKPPIISFEYE